MSVETKHYIIEYFEEDSGTPVYDFYSGEDAYDAVYAFRVFHKKAKIQNVALILDMKESVYE